jgi:hypothetical protein
VGLPWGWQSTEVEAGDEFFGDGVCAVVGGHIVRGAEVFDDPDAPPGMKRDSQREALRTELKVIRFGGQFSYAVCCLAAS